MAVCVEVALGLAVKVGVLVRVGLAVKVAVLVAVGVRVGLADEVEVAVKGREVAPGFTGGSPVDTRVGRCNGLEVGEEVAVGASSCAPS